jgi:hypothetical protein
MLLINCADKGEFPLNVGFRDAGPVGIFECFEDSNIGENELGGLVGVIRVGWSATGIDNGDKFNLDGFRGLVSSCLVRFFDRLVFPPVIESSRCLLRLSISETLGSRSCSLDTLMSLLIVGNTGDCNFCFFRA